MNESRLTELAAVRRLVAVVLLIASPGIAYLQWDNATDAIATLRQIQQSVPTPLTRTDSETVSSAAYHAAHATETMDGRWGLTGFMTLGALGFALGTTLMAWPWLRRKAS